MAPSKHHVLPSTGYPLVIMSCIAAVKPISKKDKHTLRMVFEAWREYAVETQARRFRKDLPLEQRGQSCWREDTALYLT